MIDTNKEAPVLLDVEGVKQMIGWKSTTSVYDAMRLYGFPKQIYLTPGTIRWDKRAIERWIIERARAA